MNANELKSRFLKMQETMHAYTHAEGVMYYDSATVAPSKSYALRGDTLAEFSRVSYELYNRESTTELLAELVEVKDELDPETLREIQLINEFRERTSSIPADEYAEYTKLCNDSEAVWHAAKLNNDFAAFRPYLEKVMAYCRRFALYRNPNGDPYETIVDDYEKGLTRAQLESFFSLVKQQIIPLIQQVGEKQQPDDGFLCGDFPIEKQRELSDTIMRVMTIDPERCILGETEHPFTIGFGTDDMRITTHYHRESFASSMYTVLHEGGHALYELCGNPAYNKTALFGGVSMGIHESQSRFFENIIGRSRAFCNFLMPQLARLFPQLARITPEQFYRAANRAQPSLIRTEADELTYPVHILIRYELESALINGELTVAELPAEWAARYKKYLGIDVPDDTRGVLQDSHWSGGLIGYFPSYALGSAYGAQILHSLKADVAFDADVQNGRLADTVGWLTDKIYKYQSMLTPAQVLLNACGAPFDPSYYTAYLNEKYADIYSL